MVKKGNGNTLGDFFFVSWEFTVLNKGDFYDNGVCS